MKDVRVIDQALEILRRKPVDGYEIYLDQSSHFEVESKEGKVDTLQASHSWGMAFRILNHRKTGFSYTTFSGPSQTACQDFPAGLERIIEDAIASAEAISPDPCFDFAPVFRDPPSPLPIFDDTLEGVSEKTKIERAKCLEEATRSVDPERIKKVRKASYQEVHSRRTLINSNGLQFTYDSTLTSISVTAVAEASGASEVGWDFDYSHFFNDLDVEKVGRSAGRKALERLGGRRISSGVYPVLLRNHVASEFLSLLAHSFLSEQVQKGKSPLKGKRGERFFSSLLSFVDDGLLPKGISTSPIDGEGMPCQRTFLVIQGEVSGYLYDRYWANRENASSLGPRLKSTGNSRRHGIKSPPGIGISNFFIEPGKIAPSDLTKDLDQGLVVEEVLGLHTVNPISGDFSLGCSGDWVERGEKVHPVKSIAIAGNLFQLFGKVIGVGEDLRFFGRVGSPSLFVEGMEISGN
ncbi:MAG: TldD/PmbA family protein [Thermodesulfobacteriota bacterium]